MRLYLLSPQGVPMNPHLFPVFKKTWEENGCEIADSVADCDVVLWDLHTREADYNPTDIGRLCIREIPVATFDEWDRGGMSDDVWPAPLTNQQLILWREIKSRSVHFCRKINKTYQDAPNLYPLEKTIMNEFPFTTSQELISRPYDIFFYGNTSPQRESVCNELSKHFKCDFRIGQEKIPHDQWLNRARQSKLYLTADGGGFSDERPYQLFSIAPMLKQRNNHLQSHPFIDETDCIEIGEIPTEDDIIKIKRYLNYPDELYRLYLSQIVKMKQYYSAEYTANYILNIIKKQLSYDKTRTYIEH